MADLLAMLRNLVTFVLGAACGVNAAMHSHPLGAAVTVVAVLWMAYLGLRSPQEGNR